MSIVGDALNYLAARGDIVEFSLMATRDGRYQANRRFTGSTGYGVNLSDDPVKAVNDSAMGAMRVYPFPDGPLQLHALPARKEPWDPAGDELLGVTVEETPDELLDETFNKVMDTGTITSLRITLLRDGNWEVFVGYANGCTGPTHWAAPRNDLASALRAIVAHRLRNPWNVPKTLDDEIHEMLG